MIALNLNAIKGDICDGSTATNLFFDDRTDLKYAEIEKLPGEVCYCRRRRLWLRGSNLEIAWCTQYFLWFGLPEFFVISTDLLVDTKCHSNWGLFRTGAAGIFQSLRSLNLT